LPFAAFSNSSLEIYKRINAPIERKKPINNPTEKIPTTAHTAVKTKYRRLNAVTDPANAKAEKKIRGIESNALSIVEKYDVITSSWGITDPLLEAKMTAVKIPRIPVASSKNDAAIGLFVFFFIDERIVFLGSPYSSHPHSSSGSSGQVRLMTNK
jgi:hypothetical protein